MAITDAFRAILQDYVAPSTPSIPTEELVGKVLIFSEDHEDDVRAGGKFLVFGYLPQEDAHQEKTYVLARLDEPDEEQPLLGIWAQRRGFLCHSSTKQLPLYKGGEMCGHMLSIFMIGGWPELEKGAQNLGNGVQYIGANEVDNLLRGRTPSPTFKIARGFEVQTERALCKLIEEPDCQIIPVTPESVFSDVTNEALIFQAMEVAGPMDMAGWSVGRN